MTPERAGAMEKKDIFDKLMSLPVLRCFEGFYKKHKAVLLYLFFGGLTTLISIGSFVLAEQVMDALLANVISWVAAVSFAYVTNRIWVFSSTAVGAKAVIREVLAFFGGRLLTLGFEELVLLLLIHFAHWDSTLVKLLAQLGVLVLNFVISKWMVFRKKKT